MAGQRWTTNCIHYNNNNRVWVLTWPDAVQTSVVPKGSQTQVDREASRWWTWTSTQPSSGPAFLKTLASFSRVFWVMSWLKRYSTYYLLKGIGVNLRSSKATACWPCSNTPDWVMIITSSSSVKLVNHSLTQIKCLSRETKKACGKVMLKKHTHFCIHLPLMVGDEYLTEGFEMTRLSL